MLNFQPVLACDYVPLEGKEPVGLCCSLRYGSLVNLSAHAEHFPVPMYDCFFRAQFSICGQGFLWPSSKDDCCQLPALLSRPEQESRRASWCACRLTGWTLCSILFKSTEGLETELKEGEGKNSFKYQLEKLTLTHVCIEQRGQCLSFFRCIRIT